jgi:hypothetical protein
MEEFGVGIPPTLRGLHGSRNVTLQLAKLQCPRNRRDGGAPVRNALSPSNEHFGARSSAATFDEYLVFVKYMIERTLCSAVREGFPKRT